MEDEITQRVREAARLVYQGHPDLKPADAHLNLPVGYHSHGLRRLAAVESTRGPFQQATDAIFRTTGQRVGKRQAEAMTVAVAGDVEAFYTSRRPEPAGSGMVLAISADANGTVMRPQALRPARGTPPCLGRSPAASGWRRAWSVRPPT